MSKPAVITIDGPAGSGKSTLGERLAQALGYVYFDTGVMYRAVTVAAQREDVDLGNGTALEALAQRSVISVLSPTQDDGRQYTVLLNGEDVTWDLRGTDVDHSVSQVSSYPGVRTELIRQQRTIGHQGRVVMVGRDIGTVVMPDAPYKLYLDASLDERARRRQHDLQQRGHYVELEQVRTELARRDELDHHVMYPAADALVLSTDTLAPDELVARVLALLETYESSATIRRWSSF
jgi:cytidylate kinase